jgi:5'-nucleotidase, C-terminal domain
MSSGERRQQQQQRVVHLVVSWTTLLPGDLFDCQPAAAAGISNATATATATTTTYQCTGGVAATAAYARYYANQTDATTTKTLVVPFLDTTSTLVQIHPLGWSLNRLVLQSQLGWNVCLSSPSILTQNRVDYSISPRDISDLQTLQLPLLLTNAMVPPTNSWYPYTQAIHLDAATGLALLSIYSSNQFLNVDQIASARGMLNYIHKINRQAGCHQGDDDDQDVYDEYLNETSTSDKKDGTCYLPVILYADVKERLDDFILVIAWHDHPPALIIDTAGSATDLYATPRTVGPSGVWVHSFGLEQDMYHQHILNIAQATSDHGPTFTNVWFVVEPLADLPLAAQDDTYESDMVFLEDIANEALASDPVVGASGDMPAHRTVGSYRRCNGGECPLGNLFTDALRWRTSADVAFVSSGGLRGPGWAAGPVHMSDIWRALPFPNTYVCVIFDVAGLCACA